MSVFEKINSFLWQFIGRASDAGHIQFVGTILGIFLLLSLLALARRYLFKISVRGTILGFVLGILLMIILDLVIIIGLADKKALAEFSKSERRKEATQEILVSGFSNLGKVLGVSTVSSGKKPKNAQEVLNQIFLLPKSERQELKDFLCQ